MSSGAYKALPYLASGLYGLYDYYNNMPYKKNSTRSSGVKRTRSLSKKRYAKGRKTRMIKSTRKRKSIRGELVAIKRSIKSDQAKHTHRQMETGQVSATENTCTYLALDGAITATQLESVCANLRYFDPGAPTTLATASAVAGTYSRSVHFDSVYSKCTVRNNYQVPLKLTIMSFVPKNDTGISPTFFYSNGITDQTISGSATQPLSYITDIDLVNDNWKVLRSKTLTLQPAGEAYLTYAGKAFDYDPSNYDTHSLNYQKKYRAHIWVIRIEGALAHDTTLNQIGLIECSLDYRVDNVFKISYDAGTTLNDYSYSMNADTFTNGPTVSNKPVSDNQVYSHA